MTNVANRREMITPSSSVPFGTPIYSNVETSDILNNTKNELYFTDIDLLQTLIL